MKKPGYLAKNLNSSLKNRDIPEQKSGSSFSPSTVQRILFLAPEWGTITKVGGLADVVASLSQALMEQGLEVRTVLLGYRHIRMKLRNKYFNPQLPFFLLEECQHPDYPGHTFYLIRHPALETIHEPYTPSYSNNDTSLDMLQAILLALAPFAINENPEISWKPDLVHGHDWLCGLFPYFNHHLTTLLPNFSSCKIPSLLTIHNAVYMGTFSKIVDENFYNLLRQWGIAVSQDFQIDDWKHEDQINLLVTGLRYAEKINTVSPNHARELLLENSEIATILRERKDDFNGILNGADNINWNPSSDPFLAKHTYRARKHELKKAKNYWKKQLEEQLQFPINPRVPLFISICRVVKQKGLDDLFGFHAGDGGKGPGLGPMVEALDRSRCQLIILGEGEYQLELQLQMLAWQHSQSFMFLNYFHEEMAHMLTAAADFFIMPSRYEPCGLNQLYSLRYGTTPIVRETGGLADTVQHRVNGLVFANCSPEILGPVLNEAFYLWNRKPNQLWAMKQVGMEQDFSWQSNLHDYIDLYNSCLNKELPVQVVPSLPTGHEPL